MGKILLQYKKTLYIYITKIASSWLVTESVYPLICIFIWAVHKKAGCRYTSQLSQIDLSRCHTDKRRDSMCHRPGCLRAKV